MHLSLARERFVAWEETMKLLLIAVWCAVLAVASGSSSYVLLDAGHSIRGTLTREENEQTFITRLPTDIDWDNQRYYLLYRVATTEVNVCIYAVSDGVPAKDNYNFSNCTNSDSPREHGGFVIDVVVPVNAYAERRAWATSVVGPGNQDAPFLVRVDGERGHASAPPPPRPSERSCPRVENSPSQSLVVAGPLQMDNFCYYMTLPGQTCDAACSALGGSNFIDLAIHTFPEGCPSHCSEEPVNRFVDSANVFHWEDESRPTAFQTIGYGYANSYYVCHCRNGSQGRGGGALVGDYNNHDDRSIICPCFYLG